MSMTSQVFFKPRRYLNSASGSSSLLTLLSVGGGFLFTFVFFDFVRFIGSTGAVEQSARAAARCVTPTDPECATLQSANNSVGFDWYGVTQGTPQTSETFVDRYQYTAWMQQQPWTLSYSTYEVKSRLPVAELKTLSIPVKEFEAPLNSHLQGLSTIQIPAGTLTQYYRPLTEPNFPSNFNDDDYWGAVRVNIENRINFENERGNPQPFRQTNWVGPKGIAPGGSEEFVTGFINIPELPDAAERDCRNSKGKECSAQPNAGGSYQEEEWKRYAYVAFVPMSQVTISGAGSISLAWRNREQQDRPGIWLQTRSRTGDLSERICLGGRREGSLSGGTHWYNDYMRGVSGASDGASTQCASNNFSNLRVERGGAFRIGGSLGRADSNLNADVTGRMKFLYWFDDYELFSEFQEKQTVTCKDVPFSSSLNRPLCDRVNELLQCPGIKKGHVINKALCASSKWSGKFPPTRFEPVCTETAHTYPVTALQRQLTTIKTAPTPVCSTSWRPGPEHYSLDSFSTICGDWLAVDSRHQPLEVFGAAENCPLASARTKTVPCSTSVALSLAPTEKHCPEVVTAIETLNSNASTQSLSDSLGLFSAEQTSFLATHFTTDFKTFWEPRWNLSAQERALASTDCTLPQAERAESVICKSTNTITNLPEHPILLSANSSNDAIRNKLSQNLRSYFAPSHHSGTLALNSETLEDMDLNPAGASTPLYIHGVYPFLDTPTVEIPYWGGELLADYDSDCSFETTCQADFIEHTSEEAALRHYASSAQSEAVDNSLSFNYTKTYADTISLQSAPIQEISSCTPFKTLCSGSATQGTLVHLGTTPTNDVAHSPTACSSGSYSHCFTTPKYEELEQSPYSVNINHSLAESIGHETLRQLLPVDGLNCSDALSPRCATVRVDTSDERTAKVSVHYAMPLSFPLNKLVGSDVVIVQHEKQELLELPLAGRTQ